MANPTTPRAAPGAGVPDGYDPDANPWPGLWALCIGFFMILVDSTIVSVATPAILADLDATVSSVVWVTSAYLLAYAVPLLITGRLGDRVGPKNLYLVGLAVFTVSSVWCGLTGDVGQLILARVFQGLGASLMTPQTMAVITRTFPPTSRGQAMGLWGATAGVATLVGPIVGGVLVDALGWEWIFFVNLPVGLVGLVLAWRLVPTLPTRSHSFDWLGVVLSAVGMFCLVFGIQEGRTYDWGTIVGPVSVWLLIGVGVAVLALFVLWQARNRREPLVPLSLFGDRNFSLANIAITTIGFSVTALAIPLMLYSQTVRGWSPTQSALLLAPMAVVTAVLAPFVGRLVDRVHPRYLAGGGTAVWGLSLLWLSLVMTPDASVLALLAPLTVFGFGGAFVWAPLSTTATRNLELHHAGAGSGVYNTTRQVGAVLGSASIAVLMESRLAANLPGSGGGSGAAGIGGGVVPMSLDGIATAMAQAMLLPAAVVALGFVAVLFFATPRHLVRDDEAAPSPDEQGAERPGRAGVSG